MTPFTFSVVRSVVPQAETYRKHDTFGFAQATVLIRTTMYLPSELRIRAEGEAEDDNTARACVTAR